MNRTLKNSPQETSPDLPNNDSSPQRQHHLIPKNKLHHTSLTSALNKIQGKYRRHYEFEGNRITKRFNCAGSPESSVSCRPMEGLWKDVNRSLNLHKLKGFRSCSIDYSKDYQVTEKALQLLHKAICENLQEIQSLNIVFAKIPDDYPKILELSFTKNLHQLQKLTIDIDQGDNEIQALSFHTIGLSIRNVSMSLQYLDINFGCVGYLRNKDYITFAKTSLRYFKELRHLKLYFNEAFWISYEGVNGLITQIIKHMKKLKFLSIESLLSKGITTDQAKSLRLKVEEKLPGLEFFHFKHLPTGLRWTVTNAGVSDFD